MKQEHRTRSQGVERTSVLRSSGMRLTRSIVLGAVAITFAILWVGDQFGIERDLLLDFLGGSVLFVLLLVGVGLLGAVVMTGLRKLLKKP